MSILINTKIGLPKNCDDCFIECDCPHGQSIDGYYMNSGRPKNCPLIEVPDGHGNLIDEDALLKVIDENWDGSSWWYINRIEDAPIIIPADKEGI